MCHGDSFAFNVFISVAVPDPAFSGANKSLVNRLNTSCCCLCARRRLELAPLSTPAQEFCRQVEQFGPPTKGNHHCLLKLADFNHISRI